MKQLSDQVTFKHGTTVKNRFVQAPMLTASGVNGAVSQDTLDYWKPRADSAGIVITEYNYVSENGGPALSWQEDRTQLAVYDDKFLPGLTKLAQVMKSGGNKALLQIAHTGREASYRAHLGLPVYAPSSANYPFLPYGVQAFTTEQVEEVVKDFGKAAVRAVKAGFDGIEIHGANHYLIQQFFSPFSNQRTDKWGKPSAFPLAVAEEVFKALKDVAPKDFIIGYRISPEEINPDGSGYSWHESTKLIGELTKRFDFDYIHLSLPAYDAKPADSDQTFAELFRPFLGEGTKLIIVGNVMDQAAAENALQYTDLVAVGRAQIIDAHFAKKILAGEAPITEMSDEEEIKQKLTPGLREVFEQKAKLPNFGKKAFAISFDQAVKVDA